MPSSNCSFHALRPKVGNLNQSHGRCAFATGGMVCHTRIDGMASNGQSSSALLTVARKWVRKARGIMQERRLEGYDSRRNDIVRAPHLQRKRAVLVLLAALQLLANVRQLLRGGSQQLPVPLLGLRRESPAPLLRLRLDQRGWRLAVQPPLACPKSECQVPSVGGELRDLCIL